MRLKCSLFVMVLITLIIAKKGPVSISTFLVADEKSSATESQKDKVKFLKKSSSNMPIIDDFELRIRNRAYEFDRQRYSLRLEPRGFGETRASRNFYKTNLARQEQRKAVLESRLLKSRYYLALDYMYTQSMLALYRQLNVLYEDKIKVSKNNNTGSMELNLVGIIDVENDYTKLKFDNIERERTLKNQKGKIKKILSQSKFAGFDTTSLIRIDRISKQIDSTKYELDPDNVYVKYGKLQLDMAKNRYNLETAEGRRYINFFEFSYDHDNMRDELETKEENESKPDYLKENYNLNKAYMMEVGLRIPFFNIDRHDINRRKLSYLSEKEDFKELKKELEKKIEKDAEDIRILISQYTFLQARKNDVDAESSLKKYLELDGVDPVKLLSIRENILRNDIKMEKIKFDILRNYIRIIDATGQLYKKPLRNYLSSNMEFVVK